MLLLRRMKQSGIIYGIPNQLYDIIRQNWQHLNVVLADRQWNDPQKLWSVKTFEGHEWLM